MSPPQSACPPPASAECQLAQGYAYLAVTRGFPLAVDYVAGLDLTGHGLRFEVLAPLMTLPPLLTKSTELGTVTITSARRRRYRRVSCRSGCR
jgi:hypothetical protein